MVVPYLEPDARPLRASRVRCDGTTCLDAHRGGRSAGLRPPSVRSSALHHVLVRHHRPAQVHGARCGRDAAAASEGAGAAHRPRPRRPAVLLHHLRLDDVELAGVGPRRPARPSCCSTARRWRRRRSSGTWRPTSGSRCSGPAPSTWRWRRRRGSSPAARTICRRCGPSCRPGARSPRTATTTSTRSIKRDLHLASISGGTDIISCFALGNPAGPVWRGELQTRGLGMAVEVFDAEGRPVPRQRRRAGVHPAVPQHAGRLLGRSGRREVPCGLLRALSRTSGGTATGPG